MKNSIVKLKFVILVLFWILGCEDSGVVKEVYPISDVNFHYLQASNKLFVSAQVSNNYKGSGLDSVMVLWKGVSSSNTADTIRLLDDGTEGDMISKDLFDEFSNGDVQTLRLGDYISGYDEIISDHRPVVWRFTP